MNKRIYISKSVLCLCLASLFLLASCSINPTPGRVGGTEVRYDDANAVETVSADYGSTDLQNTAEFMTQSLLSSSIIADSAQKPRIRMHQIKNYTDEHIDTKGIADKIRVKLLRSGQVVFLADSANLDQVFEERDFTESTTVKNVEAMTASDYILTGSVRSISKRSKDITDVFYQITLELTSPQSGEIIWAEEKEIRKVETKARFGW